MIDKDYGAKVPILNSMSYRKCVTHDAHSPWGPVRGERLQALGGPGAEQGASLTALALAWWWNKQVRRRVRGHRGSGTQV